MTMKYPDMRPAKDAGRLSRLVMNPDNPRLSAERRGRLLEAFDSLDCNARADLLEAVESLVLSAGMSWSRERDTGREVIHRIYAAAGWES